MPSPAEPGVQHGKSEHHLLHANLTGLSRAAHRLCRAPPARRGVERKDGDGARLSLSSSQILLSSLTSWWPKTSTSRAERLLGSTESAKATTGTNVSSSAAAHFPSGIYTWVSYRDTDELVGTNIFLFFFVTCIYFFQSVCLIVFFISPVTRMKSSAFKRNALLCTCALFQVFTHTHTHRGIWLCRHILLCVQTDISLYVHVCMCVSLHV